jgi:hypothetical protein
MDHLASQFAAPVIGHPGSEARVWAARISECWRSSVESIIRAGRLLLDAKADLPHGEFGAMCARDLPFSERTAQRLMAIAEDKRLSNPTHVSLLPASWGTLAELTKLSDDEFSSALKQKIISPDMVRADVEQIRALSRPRIPEPAEGTDPDQNVTGGVLIPSMVAEQSGEPEAGEMARVSASALSSPALLAPGEPASVEVGRGQAPEFSSMPSGGLAIAHRRVEPDDSRDFFPTPPWATRAFVEHVLTHLDRRGHCQFQSAWEPACGEGHMSSVLGEYFRSVAATDVLDYSGEKAIPHFYRELDFLSPEAEQFAALVPSDWIITNPPFNCSVDFVLKALQLASTGVAMFVRMAWLETEGRYERIFRDRPPTLISFFVERVPLHKGRWEPDGGTFTAYIWLTWIKGAEPRAPFWIPPGCRERLTKPDDVKRFGKSSTDGEAA